MPYYSQCCEILSKPFLLLLIQKSSRSFSLQSENNHKLGFGFFFPNLFLKSRSYIYWNWLEICHGALPVQVSSFGLGDQFQHNAIVSVGFSPTGIGPTASLISVCSDRTLNPPRLWSGSAEAITYSEIPKDQEPFKHKKARLYLNKIRNFPFKWRELKVAGAGRAEVERFLLHCLSVLACGLYFIWFKPFAEIFCPVLSHPYKDSGSFGSWLLLSGASWCEWGHLYPCPTPCHPCPAPSASREPSGKGSVPVAPRDTSTTLSWEFHEVLRTNNSSPSPKTPSPLSWFFLPPQLLGYGYSHGI